MTQEAMKLALEALTNAIAVRNGEGGTKLVSPLEENAITAIKEALAQTQEPDYWLGYGLQAHTEKPFESATPLYTHPPQRTEQNFCSRCGKRTADLTTIHTCTPPQD